MRIIILPDIHGRIWWKDILDNEEYDLVVFLGDYVSSHDDIDGLHQINNLENILDFKEANPDKVILLRGNHDVQHLGYYWAECSGLFPEVEEWLSRKENKERFLNDTQWIYLYKPSNILFSHAGISKTWLKKADVLIRDINNLPPSELFGFTPGIDNPYDCYGDSIYQPCTWIRPGSLLSDMPERYTQVVGHTPFNEIVHHKTPSCNVYFCDCNLKEYLVFDSGEFEAKKIPPIK